MSRCLCVLTCFRLLFDGQSFCQVCFLHVGGREQERMYRIISPEFVDKQATTLASEVTNGFIFYSKYMMVKLFKKG